ncbi:MAG: prolipoprotein diacylglyceryl transferase family protein, partial [Chloroflexota bacterium]|nr:prolipoprotein diacylglyceryl transferase family protein [Chloroflexota bacterium]
MFTINIDPVAFHIGALSVKWYGIMVALAVATLLLVSSREAKRLDISLDTLYSIFLWGILGGLIGARLVYLIDCVVTHPGQPVHIIGFAGLGLFGAILGALLAV